MRLVLGTAQFSNQYGVLKKKVNVKKIFKFINGEKIIKSIDTSPFYGEAEKIIGKNLERNIKIITKINPFKFISTSKNLDNFKKDFDNTLKNLQTNSVHGLLFHKESDIMKIKNDFFFYYLDELKKHKIIKKIGFSSYNLDNINYNMNLYNFKIVQLPVNIFNSRYEYIRNINYYRKKFDLEFHARSIFLQGLGFLKKIKSPRFKKLNDKLIMMDKISKKFSITNYDLMLSGVSRFDCIDSFIIGCSSYSDLIALKKFNNHKLKKQILDKLIINDIFINDPRKWPRKINYETY